MGFPESLIFLNVGFVSCAKIAFLGDLGGFVIVVGSIGNSCIEETYSILELVLVTMSGGTPVSGGLMRQRHSQGYASSGDDLEDDACSRGPPPPPLHRPKSWTELAENFLWIASAIFILYYGDAHSNFIYILWNDDRIRRPPLYLGMVGVFLNVGIFSYMNLLAWGIRKTDEKLEVIAPSVAPLVTMVGIVSFCLYCIALWPIWSFLSLPLLFTLFMACMVVSPYMMFGKLRQPIDVLRTD